MPLRPDLLERLELQPLALQTLLGGASDAVLRAHPAPDKWSALENLAHLARYHEIFFARLDQMLNAPGQPFARYKAEDDPEWPRWQAMGGEQVLVEFHRLRGELQQRLRHLSDAKLACTGLHPAFGRIDVPTLLEMLLLHEGHHLYLAFQRIFEQRH